MIEKGDGGRDIEIDRVWCERKRDRQGVVGEKERSRGCGGRERESERVQW